MTQRPLVEHVVCVERVGDGFDVIAGKIYAAVEPEENDPPEMIRILDEEGEDYLYPRDWFLPIELPEAIASRLATLEAA